MDGMEFVDYPDAEADDAVDPAVNIADIAPDEDAWIHQENGYKLISPICETLQGSLAKAEVIKECDGASVGSYVAIKRTHKTLFEQKMVFEDADGMNEFVEEDIVKEAMILNHLTVNNQAAGNHIVKFVDFYESESHFYLVTEWIEGDNLLAFSQRAHELMEEGRLSRKDWNKTVKYILWQLTATIRWLHVVFRCCHLDLVMENCMVFNCSFIEKPDGSVKVNPEIGVKIIDFGVAELFDIERGSFDCMKNRLTIDNGAYVAPKVFANDIYDARSADIWSLGMILYQMSVGEKPYEPEDVWDGYEADAYLALKHGRLRKWLKMNNLARCFKGNSVMELLGSLLEFEEEKRLDATQAMQSTYFTSYWKRYGQHVQDMMERDRKKLQSEQERMRTFPYYNEI